MATVFEDRSTYDAKVDSVATLTLTVECHPGQVASISQFLVGVSAKAGVYGVAIDHVVAVPERQVANAEPVQHEAGDEPEAVAGERREADVVGAEGVPDSGAHGELAGVAGEVGTGPLERSA